MTKKKSASAKRNVVVATPKHTLVVGRSSVVELPMKGKGMPEKIQQGTKANGATDNKDATKVAEANPELADVVKAEVVKVEVVDKKAAEVTNKTPIDKINEQKIGNSDKTSFDTNINTNELATRETEHNLTNTGDDHSDFEPYVMTATYALTTDKLTDPIMKDICATIETCASDSPPPSPPKAHAPLPYASVVNTNDLLAHLTTIATQVSSVLNQNKISGTTAPIDAELKKYLVRTNLLFYQIQRANGKSMADINLDLGHTSLTVNLVKELRENTLGCYCIFDCARLTETLAPEPTVVEVAVQRPALGLRGRSGNLSEEEKKTAPAASALVNLANIALMAEATPIEKPKYSFYNPDPDDPLPPDFEKKAWKTARKQRQKANKKGKTESADGEMADEEERVAEVVRAVKARVEADIAATIEAADGAPIKAAVAVRGTVTAGNAGAPIKAPIQTTGPVTGPGNFNKTQVTTLGSFNKVHVTGPGIFNRAPFTGPGNFNKAPVTGPSTLTFGKPFPGHPTLSKAHDTIPGNLGPAIKAPPPRKWPLTASANSATVTMAPAATTETVVVKAPVATAAPIVPSKPVTKKLSYADLARSAMNTTPAPVPVAKLVPLKPVSHPSLPAKPSFPMPHPMFPRFANNIKAPNNVATPGNIVNPPITNVAKPIVANVTAPDNTVNAAVAASAEKVKNSRFHRDAEAEEARKKARRARVKEREREGRAQRREAMARLLSEVKAGAGGATEPSGVVHTSTVGA